MHTVKLDEESHQQLQALAIKMDQKMSQILRIAIRRLARELFWKQVGEEFDRLRADPKAWASYQSEAESWMAIPDGLPDESEEWARQYPEFFDKPKRASGKRGRK